MSKFEISWGPTDLMYANGNLVTTSQTGWHSVWLNRIEREALAAALRGEAPPEPAYKVGDVVETPAGNAGFVELVSDQGMLRVRDVGAKSGLFFAPRELTLLERDGKPAA